MCLGDKDKKNKNLNRDAFPEYSKYKPRQQTNVYTRRSTDRGIGRKSDVY